MTNDDNDKLADINKTLKDAGNSLGCLIGVAFLVPIMLLLIAAAIWAGKFTVTLSPKDAAPTQEARP